MVEISKHLYDRTCTDQPCHFLLHPWNESCIKNVPLTYWNSTIGSAKFYSVVYLIQIIIRGKKMLNKDEWVKMGEYYARSTLLGLLISANAVTQSCLIRRLLGNKFTYYGQYLIPNMLSGVCIYLEPPSRRGLVINLFCNLVIELWLKMLERSGHLVMTKTKQTLMFMIGSSFLFYLMRLEGDRKHRTPLVWLFTPEKVRRKTDESRNVCPHDGPCGKYIAKGYGTYFGVGLGISLARLILPKISSPMRALTSIRGKHFKMALFFGSYIGIYRAVVCYLSRKRGFDSALYALPAGYLAGLSFLFSPNLGFAIASLTAAAKLYSTILYDKKVLTERIPLPEILYCLCQGTLFHSRMMHPEVCPNYVFKLMDTVSNGCTILLYENLVKATSIA